MIVKTAQQIIDAARPAIRHDTDSQVTDAQLLIWLGEHVRGLHSMSARLARGMYTQSARFTLQSGNSVTIQSAPLDSVPANTYLDFRGIDYDISGGYYAPMQPLPFRSRAGGSGRQYMLRGNTIDLFPSQNATGNYRLWYLAAPMTATVPTAITSFNLPEGGDMWLSEALAARSRVRFQQDPTPHLEQQRRCWRDIIKPWLLAREAAGGSMLIGNIGGREIGIGAGQVANSDALGASNLIPAHGDGGLGGVLTWTTAIGGTATAGRLLVCCVMIRQGGPVTGLTGGGLTWTLVASHDSTGGGVGCDERLYVFTATASVNVSLADLTVTWAVTPLNVIISVDEVLGSSGFVAVASRSSSSAVAAGAITMAAVGLIYEAIGLLDASTALTPSPGFTQLANHGVGAVKLATSARANVNSTAGWTWTGNSAYSDIVILFGA